MRKYVLLCICIMLLLFFHCVAGLCEIGAAFQITEDEWSWNPASVNTFTGQCDLSEFMDLPMKLYLDSDLPADEDTEAIPQLVFTYFNDERIAVLDQSDTYEYIPASDGSNTSVVRFSGRVRLPKKPRVRSVCFTLRLIDANGNELKSISSVVSSRNTGSTPTDGSFYISADVKRITLICSVSAALIWIIAIAVNIIVKKKKTLEETNHADI